MNEFLEFFFKENKKQRYSEIDKLKQSEEARCFAWIACYSICKSTAVVKIDENDGNPRLHVRSNDLTMEILKNCQFLYSDCDSVIMKSYIRVETPTMKIRLPRAQVENGPYTTSVSFSFTETKQKKEFFAFLDEVEFFLKNKSDCNDAIKTTKIFGAKLCDGIDTDCNGPIDDPWGIKESKG